MQGKYPQKIYSTFKNFLLKQMKGKWTNINGSDLPLRSWWVDSENDCKYISIVLPEVFGINKWWKTRYPEFKMRIVSKKEFEHIKMQEQQQQQ